MDSEFFFEFGVFDFQLLALTQQLIIGGFVCLLDVDWGKDRVEIEGVWVFRIELITGRLPIEIAVHALI